MITLAAGSPATDGPLSQAWVPGLRGVLRKEDRKLKPGTRALGQPISSHLPQLLWQQCGLSGYPLQPLQPTWTLSLIPLKRVQGKNLSWAGWRDSSGESPAYPELHNQITVILHHSAHEHTHMQTHTHTHTLKHSWAELSSREGPGSGHSMRSPLI